MQPLWPNMPVSKAFATYPPGSAATESLLKVPITKRPSREMFVSRALQLSLRVPGERTSLINHIHQQFPVKELSHENGYNIRSQPTEPHADGRPTHNGVRPGSPRGSLTTLLSVPQCHTALSMIPSTLAWVDQRPVSQPVSYQPPSGFTLHNCCRLPRDPG